MNNSVNDRDDLPPGAPASGVRTVVSFLLFVFLFGLGVCIFSNPRDGMVSSLQVKLRRTPALVSALHLVWLDNGYDYVHFTGTFNERGEFIAINGTDHQLLAELQFADGSTQTRTLPDVGRFPLTRFQRYKNLNRASAAFVGDRERESLLPEQLCRWLLRESGAERVTLQIRNHLPQGRNEAASLEASRRDPMNERYYRTVFRASAQRSGDRIIYLKLEGASDSAPAPRQEGAAASPATASPPASTDAERPALPRTSSPFNLPVRP
jgi:hypothetical protein